MIVAEKDIETADRVLAGQRAPVAELSPARRTALIACFNAGELVKRNGAWHGT